MTDVIRLAGLRNTLLSLREFTLTLTDHNRPNLLIFRARGNAIGVCMVIKPSRDGDDLDYPTNGESKRALSLHYQLLMYMQQLRFTHGVQQVFGIITTYKQWRICWLPEASELASATTEPEPQSQSSSTNSTLTTSSDLSTLYGSALYEYNQPELIEVLVSTLRKMACGTVIPVTTLLPTAGQTGRKYGLISDEGFTWQDLPLSFRLSYLITPTDPLDELYLLQDYGEGLDGRVWLAATASGSLTVVKMTRESVTVEAPLKKQRVGEEGTGEGQGEVDRYMHMYDCERELWRSVWGAESTVCRTFLNACALVMQFAFHGWLYDRPDPEAAVVGSEEGINNDMDASLGSVHATSASIAHPSTDPVTAGKSAMCNVASRVKFRSPNHCLGDISPTDPATYNLPELIEQIDSTSLLKYIHNPELAAREAIRAMAEKGWKHDDLAWHHVALLPIPPTPADSLIHPLTHPTGGNEDSAALTLTVRPILIDLSHVSELEDGDTVESVVEEGMRDLMYELR